MRRRELTKDQLTLLSRVHAALEGAATLIDNSDLPDGHRIAERVALGLAFDATMFAESLTNIADEARRGKSPALAQAYRAASQAFSQARLLRASLVAEAVRHVRVGLLVRRLATLEAAALRLRNEYPDDTARLDLPACVRPMRSVAPTRGPNFGAKALPSVLGSVELAA